MEERESDSIPDWSLVTSYSPLQGSPEPSLVSFNDV